jgi:hypothetical protein
MWRDWQLKRMGIRASTEKQDDCCSACYRATLIILAVIISLCAVAGLILSAYATSKLGTNLGVQVTQNQQNIAAMNATLYQAKNHTDYMVAWVPQTFGGGCFNVTTCTIPHGV